MDESLSIRLEHDGPAVVVRAEGAIDRATVGGLRAYLGRAVHEGDGPVVVHLGGVSTMDSSGLSAILRTLVELSEHGRHLVVRAVGPAVRRVFETTRTTNLLEDPGG